MAPERAQAATGAQTDATRRDALGIETAERWMVSPVRGKLEDEYLDLAIRLMHDLDRRQHIPKMRL